LITASMQLEKSEMSTCSSIWSRHDG